MAFNVYPEADVVAISRFRESVGIGESTVAEWREEKAAPMCCGNLWVPRKPRVPIAKVRKGGTEMEVEKREAA